MKIIKQLFWIFLFSLLGEGVSILISNFVAIPGSVIGMILLFIALHFEWIKLSQVDEVGTWLTDNMAILFVPAGVGLMTNFELLGDVWFQLLIIMVVTVSIMMCFVGTLVQKIMGKAGQKVKKTGIERTDNNG
ncbi:MAG TPA: CidA/LrgA family protein [Candidatus Atopostipes pullistercoris]|uniref:CidA/LrgA family protein n=1 Tax=Candidatus Atopostipes pullistercoris TaxID=2838467 RepID=A0A9D2FZN9_9LACT|nr:CidA/LrgA family protein [Candidatus Atopostipes pullistercoris]